MSIQVKSLGFSYCTRAVLRDVSFDVKDGELIAVLGPNGVGKTTLFRCVLGLNRHYSGLITIDGTDARGLGARELAERIAYIPQLHAQAFGYSALDMTLMGAAHGVSPFSQPGKKEARAAMEALERLDVARLADKDFTHLSGGEQQLVLIARALAQGSRTLVMDEPCASLDYGNQARVLKVVKGLASGGYAVLMSTHDPQQALWYADKALALHDGRAAAFGPPKETLDEALIEKLYGARVSLIQAEAGPLIAPHIEGSAG